MAKTGIIHHIGSFLLFAAAILFLITTISSPVVNNIAILKVQATDGTDKITFGTFGYCIKNADNDGGDLCSGRHIGYDPTAVVSIIDDTSFHSASKNTSKALTRVMVLHPIVCGLSFLAFLVALGSGMCGALFAALITSLTFLVGLIVMAIDFALFVIVKNHVNKDGSGNHATFSTGIWTMLAGTIALFFAFFFVLFSCCSARMHKHRGTSKEAGYVDGVAPTRARGRFWPRRTRY